MNRRDFFCKASCGVAVFMAAPLAAEPVLANVESRKRYKIDIEIYEAREDTWCHKKGDKFLYPQDWGKVCPWLRASMTEFIRVLEWEQHCPGNMKGHLTKRLSIPTAPRRNSCAVQIQRQTSWRKSPEHQPD